MRADGSYRKVIVKEHKVSAQTFFMKQCKKDKEVLIEEMNTWEPILEL